LTTTLLETVGDSGDTEQVAGTGCVHQRKVNHPQDISIPAYLLDR
jgi:hypothetical protein